MDAEMHEFYEYVAERIDEEEVDLVPRRYIRDMENPLEALRPSHFKKRYRFEKETVCEVLFPMMKPLEKSDRRGLPIPVFLKLLVALRFYAKGLDQNDNADIHGISNSSVCVIVKEVSSILARKLGNYVALPRTREESNIMSRKFFNLKRFPGVIGCVDGTHVKITSPGGEYAEVFRNRKTFFSLNVQVLASPDMEILDVVPRYPGSFHDARIFRLSGLGIPFENGQVEGIMLGDSAYPCEPYLFTPVLNARTDAEKKYNEAHKGTRNLVERTIGLWKQRFRCLKGMNLKVENVATVVCATSVLHNISRQVQDDVPEDVEVGEEDGEDNPPYVGPQERGLLARRNFIFRHFTE